MKDFMDVLSTLFYLTKYGITKMIHVFATKSLIKLIQLLIVILLYIYFFNIGGAQSYTVIFYNQIIELFQSHVATMIIKGASILVISIVIMASCNKIKNIFIKW